MGSVNELCWTSTEDLFRELNLDSLYARQVGVLGPFSSSNYPDLILIFTGKITIGINLANTSEKGESSGDSGRMGGQKINKDSLLLWNYMEEQSE
jgi:hypothetical protein